MYIKGAHVAIIVCDTSSRPNRQKEMKECEDWIQMLTQAGYSKIKKILVSFFSHLFSNSPSFKIHTNIHQLLSTLFSLPLHKHTYITTYEYSFAFRDKMNPQN